MAIESLTSSNIEKRSITFNCFFEPLGFKSDRNTIYGMFKIQATPEVNTLHLGNQLFENVSYIDLKRYALRPVVGYIKNGNQIYKNAKVTFIKKFQGISSKIISDVCYTDSAGMYKMYVQPGVYDIEINVNNQLFVNKDQVVKDGLKYNFYLTTKAAIKEHVDDTITFTNSDYIYVQNNLVDNSKRPVNNAEIIVFDNTYIYAFEKTDENGRYRFSLKPGKYCVLIRSDSTHAKRTVINLTKSSGFAKQLMNSNLFSKDSMICI